MSSENTTRATVYGKPDCKQCEFTTKLMDKEGIPYQYVDITVNEVAHQEVKSLGYTSAPVVVADTAHWSGFSPDKIRKLK